MRSTVFAKIPNFTFTVNFLAEDRKTRNKSTLLFDRDFENKLNAYRNGADHKVSALKLL